MLSTWYLNRKAKTSWMGRVVLGEELHQSMKRGAHMMNDLHLWQLGNLKAIRLVEVNYIRS